MVLPLSRAIAYRVYQDLRQGLIRKVTMKALIILDDKESLESISQAFQMCLPECKLVSTNLGEKGSELVGSESPDIVILDLNLPDVSGFDVLKQIRCCSQVPVIILSFLRDEADTVEALELGADEYIAKPFRQLEFMARIRALLRKSSFKESKVS